MAEEVANTHYTARIVVERVNHMQEPAKSHVHNSEPTPTSRKVTELADLTVRGNDLAELIRKLKMHADLIDDIDAIDEKRKGPFRGVTNDRVR